MNSIDTDEGHRRLFRRAMLALCACGFLLSLTACNTRVTDNDFEERCKNLKSCVGSSAWPYSSIGTCIADFRRSYERFQGECRRKFARAFNCESRNFQCNNGEPVYSGCEDKYNDFEAAGCGIIPRG